MVAPQFELLLAAELSHLAHQEAHMYHHKTLEALRS